MRPPDDHRRGNGWSRPGVSTDPTARLTGVPLGETTEFDRRRSCPARPAPGAPGPATPGQVVGRLAVIPMDVADKDVHRDLASERGVSRPSTRQPPPSGTRPSFLWSWWRRHPGWQRLVADRDPGWPVGTMQPSEAGAPARRARMGGERRQAMRNPAGSTRATRSCRPKTVSFVLGFAPRASCRCGA